MQQLLDIDEVTVSEGNSAAQLPGGLVVLFGQSLGGNAEVKFEFSSEFEIGVLQGTGTNHQEKAGPLDAQGSVRGPVCPPLVVLVQERRRIDDVVVVVGIVEEVLHQRVFSHVVSQGARDPEMRAFLCLPV